MLATNCLPCHGGKKTSSGLRVDSREALLRGGDRGPAIVPGEPGKSLLIRAIRRVDDDLKMPPDRPLPEESTRALAEWVAAGAAWPKEAARKPATEEQGARHWAFERVKVARPPEDPSGWSTARDRPLRGGPAPGRGVVAGQTGRPPGADPSRDV